MQIDTVFVTVMPIFVIINLILISLEEKNVTFNISLTVEYSTFGAFLLNCLHLFHKSSDSPCKGAPHILKTACFFPNLVDIWTRQVLARDYCSLGRSHYRIIIGALWDTLDLWNQIE